MTESHEHRRLVLEVVTFTKHLLAGQYDYSLSVAQKGHRYPVAIRGCIPDVRALGYVRDQSVEVIGEAETDINVATLMQLATFLRYVEGNHSRALVLAVPFGRKGDFTRVLKRIAKKWSSVQPRVVILER